MYCYQCGHYELSHKTSWIDTSITAGEGTWCEVENCDCIDSQEWSPEPLVKYIGISNGEDVYVIFASSVEEAAGKILDTEYLADGAVIMLHAVSDEKMFRVISETSYRLEET